jgi:hypothetical protein
MYTLQVFYGPQTTPRETIRVQRAADVLTRIPDLLQQHDGCERVVVFVDGVQLFAVDCKGNRLTG